MRSVVVFERLRGQLALLERESPPELQERLRQVRRHVEDTALAVRREIDDLEHEVARLKRFSILR